MDLVDQAVRVLYCSDQCAYSCRSRVEERKRTGNIRLVRIKGCLLALNEVRFLCMKSSRDVGSYPQIVFMLVSLLVQD